MSKEILIEAAELFDRATYEDMKPLFQLLKERDRVLRNRAAVAATTGLRKGDKVRLRNLSPKYLNGIEGTVDRTDSKKVYVVLSQGVGSFRSDYPYGVPGSAVEKVD